MRYSLSRGLNYVFSPAQAFFTVAIKPPSPNFSPLVLCFCLEYQLSYLNLFSSKDFLFLQTSVVRLTFLGANTACKCALFARVLPSPWGAPTTWTSLSGSPAICRGESPQESVLPVLPVGEDVDRLCQGWHCFPRCTAGDAHWTVHYMPRSPDSLLLTSSPIVTDARTW